jgi:hypothetical protein
VIQLAPLARRHGLGPVVPATWPKLPHLDLAEGTALDERVAIIVSPFRAACRQRRLVHGWSCRRQIGLLPQDPRPMAYDPIRSGLRLWRDQRFARSSKPFCRGGRGELSDGILPQLSWLAPDRSGVTSRRSLLRQAGGGRSGCRGRLVLACAPVDWTQLKRAVGQLGCQAVAVAQAERPAQADGQADPPVIVDLHDGHGFDLSGHVGKDDRKVASAERNIYSYTCPVQLQLQLQPAMEGSLGLTRFLTGNTPTVRARFSDTGASFTSSADMDRTYLGLELGLDLASRAGATLRATGFSQLGDDTEHYGASLALSLAL